MRNEGRNWQKRNFCFQFLWFLEQEGGGAEFTLPPALNLYQNTSLFWKVFLLGSIFIIGLIRFWDWRRIIISLFSKMIRSRPVFEQKPFLKKKEDTDFYNSRIRGIWPNSRLTRAVSRASWLAQEIIFQEPIESGIRLDKVLSESKVHFEIKLILIRKYALTSDSLSN